MKKEHDGFWSRKFLMSSVGFGVIEVVATVAFLAFDDKMNAEQWLSLNQWLFPVVLALFAGSSVADKRLQKDSPDVLK